MKTVAQFMQDALYDKKTGYYVVEDPIGKNGDFITSPEISQLFGEMIGVYCVTQWIKMGSPSLFNLVELGPGRATLINDLLRATKHVKGFHEAFSLHLVETNHKHTQIQKQLINFTTYWHEDVYSLPTDLPMIIIANEFFDCLPIHQYIRDNDTWHERYIKNNDFYNSVISPELNNSLIQEYPETQNGDIIEVCYQAIEIIKYLTKFKISLLVIDYGYEQRQDYISTLQAIKKHKFHSIFEDIGKADITAHVNFFALKKIALENNCEAIGSTTQRKFLCDLGIELRAAILKRNAATTTKITIDSELDRLISPSQMGHLFKALSIYKN